MEVTKTTVRNWRSRTPDSKLRRFYESLDCARLFNTRYLLDYTSINLTGDKGRLALSIVCHIGDDKAKSRKILLDWLLREKCDFNLLDSDGLTLINWLCKNNRPTLFDFFIKKCEMDIDYTTPDANLDTPLIHAVRAGNEEMVKEMLKVHNKFGISVDIQNKDGLSAYAEAVRLNFPEIAKLLQEEGKASVNVYVEPLWSLKTYDHCFKDVLNESTTSSTAPDEQTIKNDEEKNNNRAKKKQTTQSKTPTSKNNNNNNNIKREKIKKKNIIMIEPQKKPHPLKNKKITARKKSSVVNITVEATVTEKDGSIEPTTVSQRRKSSIISPTRERKESRVRKESKAFMEKLKKMSLAEESTSLLNNNESNKTGIRERSKTSPAIRASKNNNNNTKLYKTNNNGRFGDSSQCLGSAPNSHMRSRSRQNKLSGGSNTAKPLRRKSISSQRLLSVSSPTDDLDSRIAYEESRMAELMHYSTTMHYSNMVDKITYNDINNYYPSAQRVSSASRTTDQLRWLMRLRMEQNELLPGAIPPRYQLSKNDVAKIMSPTGDKHFSWSGKARKLGMVPSIVTSDPRSSETLCNSIFNRILSNP